MREELLHRAVKNSLRARKSLKMSRGPVAWNNTNGFTIVELAIVMVVIGLLIGVILKGQELIANARYKAVISQASDLTNAYYTYLNQYGKYPGDDITATSRWGTAVPPTADGNNNGKIDGLEPRRANQHLALAGIITGSYNGTTQDIPVARYSGICTATFTAAPAALQTLCANAINYTNLPAEAAQALDTALDNGVDSTGKVQADAAYMPNTTIPNTWLCL